MENRVLVCVFSVLHGKLLNLQLIALLSSWDLAKSEIKKK